MLVWMDLEMTGLDATKDVIVEIATLITDDELKIIADAGHSVHLEQPELTAGAINDFIGRWV